MENVARAISKTFRDFDFDVPHYQFKPGPRAPAPGRVEVNVIFISVRWQWIALPVLLWVLGAGALAGTFWKTRRRRAPRWKNDPLPLLFIYQDETEDEQGDEGSSKKRWVPNTNLFKVRLYNTKGHEMRDAIRGLNYGIRDIDGKFTDMPSIAGITADLSVYSNTELCT
ncbi:uncharacterized protein BDV17DRAFT_292059 [Aspergillus undulatus]|uniref:uncharacterized protein n=1 Tax=Aspergillus undulatus TaxID=1810928 RepID=UPI003CCD1EAB